MALIQSTVQTDYYIRLRSGAAEIEPDRGWLLDVVGAETNAETGVLYAVQAETSSVNAVAARSSIAARAMDVGAKLGTPTSYWIDALAGPVQSKPAGEPNFENFPEVLQYELKRLLIAPLRTEDRLFGLLTLGRSIDTEFDQASIEVVHRTARLLTAVLEHDFLQQELLERKLVDRARGILQQRRRLSDEQAHLALRSESHHRGLPMIDLAREIIEKYTQRGRRFDPEVWSPTVSLGKPWKEARRVP